MKNNISKTATFTGKAPAWVMRDIGPVVIPETELKRGKVKGWLKCSPRSELDTVAGKMIYTQRFLYGTWSYEVWPIRRLPSLKFINSLPLDTNPV